MKIALKCLIAGAGCVALVGTAFAQAKAERVDFGKREFDSNCASCHGVSGKGSGPVVELLRKSPPDLTLLAKKNGGVFPMARLYEVIDGADVPTHGTRDMPVWGRDYKIKAAEYYMEAPYDSDAYVRARILALLEYINRLQVK
ncbi:c-type cytochrome [Piscinibacter sp.]|uniref:c-type cytochrome n=1 Tax=Piscinibacter sp. TaxID=1903157 RepID=UPI00355947E9